MRKTLILVVLLLVGLGAYGTVRMAFKYFAGQMRSPEAQAAVAAQAVETLKARGAAEHPELSPMNGMKAAASQQAAAALAGAGSADQRARLAATSFFGFYFFNTRARAEYCREQGVDLSKFTDAFVAAHAAEHTRATQILQGTDMTPDTIYAMLQSQVRPLVIQDMQEVADGAKVPLSSACQLVNDNAAKVVDYLQLPPEIRTALQ